nr:MAG TPA: hypothetical protein [Caudoviricetes sp.]
MKNTALRYRKNYCRADSDVESCFDIRHTLSPSFRECYLINF